jgi:glycerol-3-phosphate dehydrogenase (NAD(P)+)
MMKKVAILGSGSWGTALAMVLADNGHDTRLWGIEQQVIDEINNDKTNKQYLPEGVVLPIGITAHTDLTQAVDDVEFIIFAVPTKAIPSVSKQLSETVKAPVSIIHVSKGIEPDSLLRISEIIEMNLPDTVMKDLVVLSGPTHAEEVSQRMITTICATSTELVAAEHVQEIFSNHYFRVYTNNDVVGVELAGALKNVIAVCAGIASGMGYGDNAKAALMTRGLSEITRLGILMGASPYTFLGLTGLGDLIVTCTSVHSRNWRCGNQLGQGKKLDEVLENMGMVVEGVRTTKAAYQLSKKYNVEMPITETLYNVLFNHADVNSSVENLMNRTKKHELDEMNVLMEC